MKALQVEKEKGMNTTDERCLFVKCEWRKTGNRKSDEERCCAVVVVINFKFAFQDLNKKGA
jgi:hypothetical protein